MGVVFTEYLGAILMGYLFGSIPFGMLAARVKGVDIRQVGSGNIGATNVARNLGKKIGTGVLVMDLVKGVVAIQSVVWIYGSDTGGVIASLAGLCAVLGHNFPCWLRFNGGKGIATSAGVFLTISPQAFLIILVTFVLLFLLSKYVSLGSISAAAISGPAAWLSGDSSRTIFLFTLIGILGVVRHHANIRRLLNGTENRFGKKSKIQSKNGEGTERA